MALTDWKPGTEQPTMDGVYQRLYPNNEPVWSGFYGTWYVGRDTIREAEYEMEVSNEQELPWRGVLRENNTL
jgi:hypothetical protein